MTVKTGLKAGKLATNHTRSALAVRTGLKAGRISLNHNVTALELDRRS
jgi:hypothetical protein